MASEIVLGKAIRNQTSASDLKIGGARPGIRHPTGCSQEKPGQTANSKVS
jgi:hypothetical protein